MYLFIHRIKPICILARVSPIDASFLVPEGSAYAHTPSPLPTSALSHYILLLPPPSSPPIPPSLPLNQWQWSPSQSPPLPFPFVVLTIHATLLRVGIQLTTSQGALAAILAHILRMAQSTSRLPLATTSTHPLIRFLIIYHFISFSAMSRSPPNMDPSSFYGISCSPVDHAFDLEQSFVSIPQHSNNSRLIHYLLTPLSNVSSLTLHVVVAHSKICMTSYLISKRATSWYTTPPENQYTFLQCLYPVQCQWRPLTRRTPLRR